MTKKTKKDWFAEASANEKIYERDYTEIMSSSFIDYSLSTINARALPDIRDGFKPVQRRVIHGMHELKNFPNHPHKKSARIVGDVMGKYHPHGDGSIYDTLVQMAQVFKRNNNLIDGQGNYGSMEGDPYAAMRYTEARLTQFALDVFLDGNNPKIVDYIDNYDQSEKEPSVLPVKLPYSLLNGTSGIAVGMSTKIPPHNLGELVDALSYVMTTNTPTTKGVMKYMAGPDFPTGGIISNQEELEHIYDSGQGTIKIRGTVEFVPSHKDEETNRKTPDSLVVTSIPYTMIGDGLLKFLAKVSSLVQDKTITDITKIENQSAGLDIRIVFELKKDADVDYIINTLYAKTDLESSYGAIFRYTDNGKPVLCPIVDFLQSFSEFQKELYTKRFQYQLEKAEHQLEIDIGLLKAISMIDVIMEIAQGSKSTKQTKKCLMTGDTEGIKFKGSISKAIASRLSFSEVQADAILRLTVSRMVGLEVDNIQKEYDDLKKEVQRIKGILSDEKLLIKEIVKNLKIIKKNYAKERLTTLDNLKVEKIEKPKEEVELVVLVDNFGYAHSITKAVYEKNEEAIKQDFEYVIHSTNMKKIHVLTDTGKVHWVKTEKIPTGALRAKGEPLDNLMGYNSQEEAVLNIVSLELEEQRDFVIVTTDGYIRKTRLSEIDKSNKTTKYVAKPLENNGSVVCAEVVSNTNKQIVVGSNDGYYVRLDLSLLENKSRTARGVRAIKLSKDAAVTFAKVLEESDSNIKIDDSNVNIEDVKLVALGKKGNKINK